MIRAQGGDPDAPMPAARETETVTAPADGYIARLDAMAVGLAAWRLGAGRARKEDPVSAAAGVICHAKEGEAVRAGQALLELRTDEPERFAAALESLEGGFEISADPPPARPLILDRVAR
jgi:thymidine phosphorylase